jgi:ribosomal protein L32
MKHGRYNPERVDWLLCERCGESKRPHRICTQHIDICAMREEDWEVEKLRREKVITEEESSNQNQ